MKVLGKRRSMIIVTLAVLLLAVGVVIGSGANFSKTERHRPTTRSRPASSTRDEAPLLHCRADGSGRRGH
jgi:hypothetical protein